MAKKALEQSRRLGSSRIAEAINLIAAADLDVRGASGLDSAIVVEILVARLARQTRPTRASRPRPAPTASARRQRAPYVSGVANHQRWPSRSRTPYSRRP